MSASENLIYLGPLDVKEDLTTGIVFYRGVPTAVPTGENGSIVARFIKTTQTPMPIPGKPHHTVTPAREFWREGEPIPAAVRAELEALYQAYPEREIANHQDHAKTYQMVAWTTSGKDEAEKEAKRQGALDEVAFAEEKVAEFTAMARQRANAGAIEVEAEPVAAGRRSRKVEA